MNKKIIFLLFIFFTFLSTSNAQKQYEMVVEKNDGSKITVNTNEINKTYFQEIPPVVIYTNFLNDIYDKMHTAGWSTTGNTHQCFGISAYSLAADVMGDDCIMKSQGSGWFWYDATYNVKSRYTSQAWRSYDLWKAYYTWINDANYIIAAENTLEGTTSEVNYIMGQAYAIRAYSYFMLAQWFARTVKGHENEPCVPFYYGQATFESTGQPRSTCAEVYAQINKDIDKAIELLNNTGQKSKNHISYAVALGLKARIALTQEDWQTAAKAAETAISESGYTIQPVSAGAFRRNSSNFINSVGSNNVMWGAVITYAKVGMYASLYAHMDVNADMHAGYDRAPKRINSDTYNLMGNNDTRRCWWDPYDSQNPYQQHKFNFSDIATYLGDYVWMRIEEMYLVAAEAECMLGNDAKAQTYLNTLVKTRDPDYNCTKTGKELGKLTSDRTGSLREAIIDQRRIELWGEYGRVYDIRRLKQGFTRTTAQGWPDGAAILLTGRPSDDPENYMWVLTIPQAEFDANNNMDAEKDQNPTADK